MKLLRRFSSRILAARGLLACLLALFIAWRAQATYDAQNLAGAGLYLLAASVMIVGCLFTYKSRNFFRSGEYHPADESGPVAAASKLRVRRVAQGKERVTISVRGTLPVRRITPATRAATPPIGIPITAGEASAALAPTTPVAVGSCITARLDRRWRWPRLPLGAIAVVASIGAVILHERDQLDIKVFVLWFLSLALLALTCIRQQRVWPVSVPNPDEQQPAEDNGVIVRRDEQPEGRGVWLLLGIIMAFALGIRLYALTFKVSQLFVDEAAIGMIGRELLHGNFAIAPPLSFTHWFAFGDSYFYPSGAIWSNLPGMVLLGDSTQAGVHFTGLLSSALNVFVMFKLLSLLFNARVGLIGAALLASATPILQLAMYDSGTEQAELLWTLSFYFFFKGLCSKRYLDFVWAGYAAAAALFFYPSSTVIVVIYALFILYIAVTRLRIFLPNYWRFISVFGVSFLLFAAPLLAQVARHPEFITKRLNEVSVLSGAGSVIAFQTWNIPYPNVDPSHITIQAILDHWQPWLQMLFEQAKHSYLGLTYYNDRTFFYQTGTSILSAPLAMLATLGIAYALWRWRDPRYFLISIWFWVGLLFSTVLTVYPPELLRMGVIVQVFFIFPAIFLNKLLYEAQRSGWFARAEWRAWRTQQAATLRRLSGSRLRVRPARATFNFVAPPMFSLPSYLNVIMIVLVALLATQGAQQYFENFKLRTQWADLNTQPYYIREAASNYYIYGVDRPNSSVKDLLTQFLAPNMQGQDIGEAHEVIPFDYPLGRDALFIASAEHWATSQEISQVYPNALLQTVPYIDGQPYRQVYIVRASEANARHGVRAGYFAGSNVDKLGQLQVNRPEREPMLDPNNPPPPDINYPAVGVWEGAFYVPAVTTYTLALTGNGWLAVDHQVQLRLGQGQSSGQVTLNLEQGWHPFSMRVALASASQSVGLSIAPEGQPPQPISYYHLYPRTLPNNGTRFGSGVSPADPPLDVQGNPLPSYAVAQSHTGGPPPSGSSASPPNTGPPPQIKPALVVEVKGSSDGSRTNAVGVDPQGNIFVGSDNPPHVYKFDQSGNPVADWAVLPDGPEGPAHLADLVVDGKGQIYVMDIVNKTLEVYDNSGKLIGHRNDHNKFAAYAPNGLAVDKAGNLYIANTGGSDILKIDPDDNLVREIGGGKDFPTTGDPHRTNQPIDVTVTDDGSVYVADLSQRIIEYSAEGKYVTEWKIPNMGGGTASMHLASYKNTVYLSDNAAEGIYVLNPGQAVGLSKFGGQGSDPGQFDNPAGLATDADGKLYVADRNNRRVQVLNLSGK